MAGVVWSPCQSTDRPTWHTRLSTVAWRAPGACQPWGIWCNNGPICQLLINKYIQWCPTSKCSQSSVYFHWCPCRRCVPQPGGIATKLIKRAGPNCRAGGIDLVVKLDQQWLHVTFRLSCVVLPCISYQAKTWKARAEVIPCGFWGTTSCSTRKLF